MRFRVTGWNLSAALFAVVLCASCAGTRDADTTPTARLTVDTHIGKSLTADNQRIDNLSNNFMPNETVFAVIDVPGSRSGTIKVRWVQGTETLREQSTSIQDNTHAYMFQLEPKEGGHTIGPYRLEVFLNDAPVDSENFEVKTS